MKLPSQDQFAGCLVGQCLADAAGFPIEGASATAAQAYVAETLRPALAAADATLFAQYSDDSQLARELTASLAKHGEWDADDYAHRIASLVELGRAVDPGETTVRAAHRLIQGADWHESGQPAPRNGAAARAAPVGLFFAGDLARIVKVASEQARITHADTRCMAGAVAIAAAAEYAATHETIDRSEFVWKIAAMVEPIDGRLTPGIRELAYWVQIEPAEAAKVIRAFGSTKAQQEKLRGVSPFVVSSVAWSLYAFLRTPSDYWETVCTAVSGGGDTDTTAAMAGAVSGAFLGRAALPAVLARRVNDRGKHGYERLVALAERAHAAAEALRESGRRESPVLSEPTMPTPRAPHPPR